MRGPDHPKVGVWLAVALGLAAAGCARPPCEETCRRVAACKLEVKQGPRMAGEPALPADPACMKRCAEASQEFAACEGKQRDCAAMMNCIPYGEP